MGLKAKHKDQLSNQQSEQFDDGSDLQEDDIDIQEQIKQKIKALSTLKDKIQAIAINGYLCEKRNLDKQLETEKQICELKFKQNYQPLIAQINAIVDGKYQINNDDFEGLAELLTEQQHQIKQNYFNNEKISEYWLKVFLNSDIIAEQIEERDEPLLKHLESIEASKSEDLKKLTIIFYFSQNQWFTNTKITKQFQLDGDTIKKGYGDQINWKQGKNITIKIVKKKKKKNGEKKIKEVKQKSFFNFFADIQIDSDQEDEEEKDQEQNDVEELQLQYQIGQNIYEDLLPKSLQYYLGVVDTINDFGDIQIEDDQEAKVK